MAGFRVRSLAELSGQVKGYFTGAIQGAVLSLWANTFRIIGKVIALLDHEHDLRRAWLVKQMFASTADDEAWLIRHGFELGLGYDAPSVAVGTVTIPARPGIPVPSGLLLVRPDGLTITTIAGGTAVGNAITLPVEPDLPGAIGNTEAGVELTLDPSSQIADGLGTVATVDAPGLTGGADGEPLESLRARILLRKRKPPQGGSRNDYDEWAREALPTIRDVFVDSFVNNSRAVWVQFTVNVFDASGNLVDVRVPNAGEVATVQAYLSDTVRRPVTARVFVSAPIERPVPLLIGKLSPDTPDIRAAIEAEVNATYRDRAQPGTPSEAFSFSQSWLSEAVSRATGEERSKVLSPADDVVFTAGFMPAPGSISYTT